MDQAYKDPLDRHAAIIPQFELNAYDALNALTMDCDAFVEGDLLITFPQCKDAEGCNEVFELAAAYASEPPHRLADAGAWWLRREAAPSWAGYDVASSASLRVFGPRPVIREVFAREQRKRPKGRHLAAGEVLRLVGARGAQLGAAARHRACSFEVGFCMISALFAKALG